MVTLPSLNLFDLSTSGYGTWTGDDKDHYGEKEKDTFNYYFDDNDAEVGLYPKGKKKKKHTNDLIPLINKQTKIQTN